jgi:L-2-hydroxyglutarate oxidase LhgO
MTDCDTAVVGGGILGLAVARELTRREPDHRVVVLEREPHLAPHQTSHNSGVVHAGIYYAPGSLKARLCVAGMKALYAFCAERGIAHDRCGKLIVAISDDELDGLRELERRGNANGVPGLRMLGAEELREVEPHARGVAALHSPETGIIDSHALMLAYLGDAEAHGAMLALKSHLLGAQITADGFVVHSDQMDVACNVLVNSAGLRAPSVARTIEGFSGKFIPKEFYAKGNYYSLTRKAPFSRLVYPVPEPGGLGVHVTLDLAGQARFGPDVEWVDRIDYQVDPKRSERFYAAIRKYWPGLPDGALAPGYAGIRPKTAGPKEPAPDFEVQGPAVHGIPGLVHLFGIESPGLTSSLALAGLVLDELR